MLNPKLGLYCLNRTPIIREAAKDLRFNAIDEGLQALGKNLTLSLLPSSYRTKQILGKNVPIPQWQNVDRNMVETVARAKEDYRLAIVDSQKLFNRAERFKQCAAAFLK